MKKNIFTHTLLALLSLLSTSSYYAQDPFGDNDLFDAQTSIPQDNRANGDNEQCLDPELLLNILSEFNILDLLQQNLYLRTNKINSRSVLDLPALQPYVFYNNNYTFTFEPFYNQTSLMYLTQDSPFIRRYITLEDTQLTSLLRRTLDQANEDLFSHNPLVIDVPRVLSLFSNIKLEERRAGVMFGFAKQWNATHLSLLVPFYYSEHNFFISDAERERIENEPFFKEDGTTPKNDETESEAYFRKHLANDRVGLGDTRVYLQAHIFHEFNSDAWLGLSSTVPTAFTLKEPIATGSFDELACNPPFDLVKLAQCFTLQDRFDGYPEEAMNFLEGTIDRLSTMVVDMPMGNGGFFGIGPKFDMAHYINYNWTLYTSVRYEYYFGKTETRFFRRTKNPADFNRDLDDDSKALENIEFINQQIINTFLPERAFVRVRPGDILQVKQSLMLDTDTWNASLGVDYWRLGQEVIDASQEQEQELDIAQGIRSKAHQVKIYGTLGYFKLGDDDKCYHAMGTFDGTVNQRGIGRDFTVGLRLGVEF
jgi:hypothetical protein